MPCSDAGQREYERKETGLSEKLPDLPWEVTLREKRETIAAFRFKTDAQRFVALFDNANVLKIIRCPCR